MGPQLAIHTQNSERQIESPECTKGTCFVMCQGASVLLNEKLFYIRKGFQTKVGGNRARFRGKKYISKNILF